MEITIDQDNSDNKEYNDAKGFKYKGRKQSIDSNKIMELINNDELLDEITLVKLPPLFSM